MYGTSGVLGCLKKISIGSSVIQRRSLGGDNEGNLDTGGISPYLCLGDSVSEDLPH